MIHFANPEFKSKAKFATCDFERIGNSLNLKNIRLSNFKLRKPEHADLIKKIRKFKKELREKRVPGDAKWGSASIADISESKINDILEKLIPAKKGRKALGAYRIAKIYKELQPKIGEMTESTGEGTYVLEEEKKEGVPHYGAKGKMQSIEEEGMDVREEFYDVPSEEAVGAGGIKAQAPGNFNFNPETNVNIVTGYNDANQIPKALRMGLSAKVFNSIRRVFEALYPADAPQSVKTSETEFWTKLRSNKAYLNAVLAKLEEVYKANNKNPPGYFNKLYMF